VVKTRNAAAVQALIDKKGLGIIFKAGADGVSPLELAFSSNNSECGRVMLKAIEDALNSGSYVMETDEKDDGPASRKGSEATAPARKASEAEPSYADMVKKERPAPVAEEPVPVSKPAKVEPVQVAPKPVAQVEPVNRQPAAVEPKIPIKENVSSKTYADAVLESKENIPAPVAHAAEVSSTRNDYWKGDQGKNWVESPMQASSGAGGNAYWKGDQGKSWIESPMLAAAGQKV